MRQLMGLRKRMAALRPLCAAPTSGAFGRSVNGSKSKETTMKFTRSAWQLLSLLSLVTLLAGCASVPSAAPPITRNLDLEALQEAVRWPNPDPQAVITLVGQFIADQRDQEGY